MDQPIELIPLICPKCQTPLPANPDEVAWVCGGCGQGLFLDEEFGLSILDVFFAQGIPQGTKGRPFWVVQGKVYVEREIFSGGDKSSESRAFWQVPRQFFVPAFDLPTDAMVDLGRKLVLTPPQIAQASPAPFLPATLSRRDVKSVAELIVLSIEVERKDMLKQLKVTLELSSPVLWILP